MGIEATEQTKRRCLLICGLFALNTNLAVTSTPVARGGLTADRAHDCEIDLSSV